MNEEIKTVTICSDTLSVEISTKGAELVSVKHFGKERLWQGNPAFWSGRSPILFPVCGALRNGEYERGGKRYKMAKHGFARNSVFSVESLEKNHAVFVLYANDETRKCYPFEFVFRVIYEVNDEKLNVKYLIENNGNGDMWAFVGSHESYLLDGKLGDYKLIFENEESFVSRAPIEGGLVADIYDDFGSGKELRLADDLFDHDTVILLGVSSRKVTLANDVKPLATLTFDAENLLLWTVVGAPYICIEPWLNYPDEADFDGDILEKKGVVVIKPGESYLNEHEIEYFE